MSKMSKKLTLSYVVLISIFSCCWQFSLIYNQRQNASIKTLQTEAANHSLMAVNGINQSLSGLRGWMLLGDVKFKEERASAWNKEILPSFQKLRELLAEDVESLAQIQNLQSKLTLFKESQQEIEDIANTVDNNPALKILLTEASPQAKVLMDSITMIIDLEKAQAATEARKELLGHMADIRGTTAASLASIRAFLLTGDPKFHNEFDDLWSKNTKSFDSLNSKVILLTAKQNGLFQSFVDTRGQFKVLPPKMFAMRSAGDWIQANYLLKIRAAPLAEEVRFGLIAIFETQRGIATANLLYGKKSIARQEMIGRSILLFCLVVSIVFVLFTSKRIMTPLTKVVDKIVELSKDILLNEDIGIQSHAEINELVTAVNSIKKSYREKETTARSIEARNNSIESTVFEAIVTLDDQGEISNINKAGLELCGFSKDQLLGKSEKILLFDAYSPDATEAQQSFLNCSKKGTKIQVKSKTGEAIDTQVSVTKVSLSGTTFEYIVAIQKLG